MSLYEKLIENEKGSALILVMVVLISGILIFSSIASISLMQRSASSKARSSTEALQMSDSCIEWTLKKYYEVSNTGDSIADTLGSIGGDNKLDLDAAGGAGDIPGKSNFAIGAAPNNEIYDIKCDIYLVNAVGDIIDDDTKDFSNIQEIRIVANAGFGDDETRRAVQVSLQESWVDATCSASDNIFVYPYDESVKEMWKDTNSACDTPECLQDNANNNDSFVDDNDDIFSDYPARDACRDVGGRLPSKSELQCIYNNIGEYGTFIETDNYWSSQETGVAANAYYVDFSDGSIGNESKTTENFVRCVKDAS